jgi:hypothetical protein
MFDTKDTEPWRQYVAVKKSATLYLGTYLTASQWAYLARLNDQYALVFVQWWFKKVTVTPVGTTDVTDWDLSPGQWVPIGDQQWQRYEVYDEPQI